LLELEKLDIGKHVSIEIELALMVYLKVRVDDSDFPFARND
jgi:hypothetical protein